MENDFAKRLAAIPEKILEMAKSTSSRNATLEEVLDHAEMLMDHINGTKRPVNEDCVHVQPFLTKRQVRLIKEALDDFCCTCEEDGCCTESLKEWFNSMHECK